MKTAIPRWNPKLLVLISVAASLSSAGCGRNRTEIREYREVQVRPEAPPPRGSPHGSPGATPPAAAPRRRAAFAWDTPKSWNETAGSGMRIASFAMGGADEQGLCTLITLSGPAGGLESNVARWLGQLDLPMPDDTAFAAFLESQERFVTLGGLPGVLVDLLPMTREQGTREDSMIVAVITIDSQTAFLKLTGSMDLLEREKEHLVALSHSLRPQP